MLAELNVSLCVAKRFEKFPKLEKLEFKEVKLEFKERYPDKLLLAEKWRSRDKHWIEHKLIERPEIPDLPFDPRDPLGPGPGLGRAARPATTSATSPRRRRSPRTSCRT